MTKRAPECPLCGHEIPLDLAGELTLSPVQRAIAAYCNYFSERYKTSPVITGADAGCIKRLVKDVGPPLAIQLIETYFRMSDSYFLQSRHSIRVLVSNLNKVMVSMKTGETITQTEVRRIDRRQANANAFGRLLGDPGESEV